jgi:hypothetical protein
MRIVTSTRVVVATLDSQDRAFGPGLSDRGDVAFGAELTDGRTVVLQTRSDGSH